MNAARRLLVLAAVMALPLAMVALAEGAPKEVNCEDQKWADKPRCSDGPQDLVEVYIDANIGWAHEVGDRIYYTFAVTNGSDDPVTVTDTLNVLVPSEEVDPGESETFGPLPYLLKSTDMATQNFTNTVTATSEGSGDTTQATATVEVTEYEKCPDPGENGEFYTDGLCIWKPAAGTWTISVVPVSNRPTQVMITVRDHVPGNWCPQGVRAKWRPNGGPVETTVTIPELLLGWPAGWAGDPVCPAGGAGGDFFNVGTLSSFYLDVSGTVTITG